MNTTLDVLEQIDAMAKTGHKPPPCIKCKHISRSLSYFPGFNPGDPPIAFYQGKPYCNFVSSPVTGDHNLTCLDARLTPGLCGPEGRFFEEQDK